MASPDCNDGWHKIAYELEAAICFADFTKPALTILRYGFAQIYGKGIRPTVMHLPQASIGARVGQDRQTIFRAIEELVGSGVLIKVKDDHYRFIKNYERWKTWTRSPAGRGKSRLSPIEIADCKKAPAYAIAFNIDQIQDQHVVHPADTYEEIESERVVHPADTYSGIRLTPRDACKPDGLQIVSHLADTHTEVYMDVNPSTDNNLRNGTDFALNSNTEKREKREDLTQNSRASEEELEPFMSPSPMVRTEDVRDVTEEALHSYMLKETSTADYPGGRADMADHAVHEFRAWVAQGYSVALVKAAIGKSIKNGRDSRTDALAFSSYAQSVLVSHVSRSLPRAPAKPSQANPIVYHVPSPRPKPPTSGKDGSHP